MQSTCWTRRLGWLVLPALVLFLTAGATAKEPVAAMAEAQAEAGQPAYGPLMGGAPWRLLAQGTSAADNAPWTSHWLGIGSSAPPPALRAQLNLPGKEGLLVEHVVPKSPAAKAGIKPFDILMKAGDKPLRGVGDLVQAVEASRDKEMTLEVLRGGKSTKVKVTPAPRPEGEAAMDAMPKPGEGDWDALHKWLEHLRPETRVPPMRFRFFHPGAILPPGSSDQPPLPANTSISITKRGSDPVKIAVTRGSDKWELTEKELDKLPADLRRHVEQMLGRGVLGEAAGGMSFDFFPRPRQPGEAAPPAPPAQPEGPRAATPPDRPGARWDRRIEERLEKRMEELNRRMDQLFKSLDEMREHRPGKTPSKAPQEKQGHKL